MAGGEAPELMDIIRAIEETLGECESILVHSMYGKNRSVFVLGCYLMYK